METGMSEEAPSWESNSEDRLPDLVIVSGGEGERYSVGEWGWLVNPEGRTC